VGQKPLGAGQGLGRLLVLAPGLGLLAQAVDAPLQNLGVGQDKLGLDDVHVPDRVHPAVHVDHVVLGKGPHHVQDHPGLADIRQKAVAQALALARALDQPGDVHEAHRGRGDHLGIDQFGQGRKPDVRHGHHGRVGLDGAKRIVGAWAFWALVRALTGWTCPRWAARRCLWKET
jgi:hypothetical protein